MFRINPDTKESQRVEEVEFAALGFKERYDIQEWVAANPEILDPGIVDKRQRLLIVAKEYSDFDKVNERVDLLAVDRNGALVIIELKRDDSGEDVHWQAVKYASYLHRASAEEVVGMLAAYRGISEEDARVALEEHLEQENIDSLNNHDTRIILASHRFAPQVTSAVLWLNEQFGRNLITCVQLTPFRDARTDALYVHTNTIIPVPGAEPYRIRIGSTSSEDVHRSPSRQREYDEIKGFFARVEKLATERLPDEIRPEKRIRHGRWRWSSMWYSHRPWGYDDVYYMVVLSLDGKWTADVVFGYNSKKFSQDGNDYLENLRETLKLDDEQRKMIPFGEGPYKGLAVSRRNDSLNDQFVETVAEVLMKFIETITPKIDDRFRNSDVAETS